MESIKINGKEYRQDSYGVLIPEELFVREGGQIREASDAAGYLAAERAAEQEHFIVLTLDGSHKVIKKHTVTIGLADRSQVHPRETFRTAILDNAVSIIIAHNHPSGSLEASVNDLLTTRRLVDAGALLRIPVVDHIIVSRDGMVSIREKFPQYFSGEAK
jgi:DNA repair protein RadC